jgi:hypothetical protein
MFREKNPHLSRKGETCGCSDLGFQVTSGGNYHRAGVDVTLDIRGDAGKIRHFDTTHSSALDGQKLQIRAAEGGSEFINLKLNINREQKAEWTGFKIFITAHSRERLQPF